MFGRTKSSNEKPKQDADTISKVTEETLKTLKKDYEFTKSKIEVPLKALKPEEGDGLYTMGSAKVADTTKKMLSVVKEEIDASATNLKAIVDATRKKQAKVEEIGEEDDEDDKPPVLILVSIGLGLFVKFGGLKLIRKMLRKSSQQGTSGSKATSTTATSKSRGDAVGGAGFVRGRSDPLAQAPADRHQHSGAGEANVPGGQMRELQESLTEARTAKHKSEVDLAKCQAELDNARVKMQAMEKARLDQERELEKAKLESKRLKDVVASQDTVIVSLKEELEVCEQMLAELTSECVTGEISSTVNQAAQELVLNAEQQESQVQEMQWRLSQLKEALSPPSSDHGYSIPSH